MFLTIVIPTHQKISRLRLCLRALAEAETEIEYPFELIIVSDYSKDGTNELVRQTKHLKNAPIALLETSSKIGRSQARNKGVEQAKGEVVLFCDDDVLLSAQAINEHCRAHQLEANIIARSNILNLPWFSMLDNPMDIDEEAIPKSLKERIQKMLNGKYLIKSVQHYGRKTKFEADIQRLLTKVPATKSGRWLACTGGSLSVSKSFFQMIRGFDSQMGLNWGAEDLEFGFRAELQGGRIKHLQQFPVFHVDHPKVNRKAQHRIALNYFAKKHQQIGNRLNAYFNGHLDICQVHQVWKQ